MKGEGVREEKKVEVTIRGKKYEVTRKKIERSLRDLSPRRVSMYSVSFDNRLFPIKQVVAETLKISPLVFGTSTAYQILVDLGFVIIKRP